MKKSNIVYVLTICALTTSFAMGFAPAAETSKADQEAAEKEIRAAADAFVESFKKRDAAAIAAHWTPDGVFINEYGQRYEGRELIQSQYESLFKNSSDDLSLQVEIDSIRLVNSQTAIEEGRAALTPQPTGAARVMSSYTAIHVKQDGKWLMTDVRDTRVVLPPDAGQLEDLEWLVGTWNVTNEDTVVELNFRWIENKNFLESTHSVMKSGKAASSGREIIGRDPSTGQITSWHFVSDGSIAVAVWAPHGSGWAVDSVGAMQDGTQTGATNILSRKDKDTLSWKSGNRFVGNTGLPETEEVTLKRK